jgi:hypothetical protein
MYYSKSLSGGASPLRVGTHAVVAFTSVFSVALGLSLFGVFLVFNIFGYIGLLAFAGALKSATRFKRYQIRLLAWIIVFLPSVSFWSSAIGKDAVAFMAMGLALWAALDLKTRWLLMAFAVLAMLFVRPHMAGIMVIGLSAVFTFEAGLPRSRRVFLGFLSIGAAAVIIPFGLQYAGVGASADVDGLMEYIGERQDYNQEGGGGVDISSMSLPMQLFTYMFRPMIFEASSIFQLAASVDNIILAFLFLLGGKEILRRRQNPINDARIFLWVYALLAWVLLAMTTSNLGIAMRHKWMFTPMLIYLLISVIGSPRQSVFRGGVGTEEKVFSSAFPPYKNL